jgi:glycosyltransferase involved in cell wall biosynthesis
VKVALVCDWYHPRIGGIELHLNDLATRLGAAGHEVVVITPTPGDDIVNGVRVHRIDAPRAPRFGFLTTSAGVRMVGDAIANERADVAHCHVSIVSPAALGGAWHAERRRIPTVVTFHSVVPRTDLLARAANFALGTGRWRVRYTAVSARVAREVKPISRTSPIDVLPNGIDVGFWRVAPAARFQDSVRLISVMRLNPKKRPLALVTLMQRLRASLPRTTRVHLRIVGDGPERARLEQAVSAAGLREYIDVCGAKPREEIRSLLAESDVFVLPTIRESFGLAALEARCAGLPVVAMAASGVSEIIAHEREGLLAQSDDDFAVQVASLVNDRGKRTDIAAHNRSTVPNCDWPRVIDAHLAVYREAIALRDSV